MSTHPAHGERIEAIEDHIEELGETRERDLHIDWAAVQESLKTAKDKSPEEGEETKDKSEETGDEAPADAQETTKE